MGFKQSQSISIVIPKRLLCEEAVIEFISISVNALKPVLSSMDGSLGVQLLDLRFFTAIDSIDKQNMLRNVLIELVKDVKKDVGKNWVPLYIAYTYATDKRVLQKDYNNFFGDIEMLLPDLLENVKLDKEYYSDKRYKNLTKSLADECKKWYINNGNLPPVNEWTSRQYTYQVDDKQRMQVQSLTLSILKSFRLAM